MKLKKVFVLVIAIVAIALVFTIGASAEEANDNSTSFGDIFESILSGTNLAILGAAIAVGLAGMGSAKGVGLVAEAASGLLSEDPSKFGSAFSLMALPMTQGVYGLVAAFMILLKIGIFGTPVELTIAQGAYFIMAALPIGVVGYFSAIKQARVSAAGINLLGKRGDELGHAITSAALVETYAIFSLLITLFAILRCPFIA